VIPQGLYAGLLILHASSASALLLGLLISARKGSHEPKPWLTFTLFRAPEILVALVSILFLFTYIYATNANMDYVQRFMASHGNLRLAPDSSAERLAAFLRYAPLLALDAAWYLWFRLRRRYAAHAALGGAGILSKWPLALALLSGLLFALAFPSFVRTAGLPALGYLCLVPLMLCLPKAPLGWGIFYGTLFGAIQAMIGTYWLGTFNLLTLQFVTAVAILQYAPFMAAAILVQRLARGAGFLVLPAAWTLFDWLRSLGFLGFPWGMLGTSQYAVLPMIQIASLTGVWGVTFVLVLCNSVIAWFAGGALTRTRRGPAAGIFLAGVLLVTLGWAAGQGLAQSLPRTRAQAGSAPVVRLALVQQNADPRKDDYRAVFDTLRRLTDQAEAAAPDLVVWSETAFVPNIRRWSQEDPSVEPLAALVRDFLAYQKKLGRWLLTGNDDYSLVVRDGPPERMDYNAAVLFAPDGTRVDTYHKIHLVPFTEYFPYRQQLPAIYRLLQNFDAYLWEPGDRRVVFRHPLASFSTPICFEDAFPDDVRRFVRAGAQLIVNISNDYWSLTETEAMQHAANAVFRAVENGRPLARASASGLTCVVDERGRILARSPMFQEQILVADVALGSVHTTLYTAWGDWFPVAMAVLLAALGIIGLMAALAQPRRRE
jgi:apolipoprotein N-acyltransferase